MFLENVIFDVDENRKLYLPSILRNEERKIVLTYIDHNTLVFSNSKDFAVENFFSNINDNRLRRKYIRYISSVSFLLNMDSKGMVVIPSYIFNRFSFFEECVILKARLGFIIKTKTRYLEEKEIGKKMKLEC